MRYYVDIDDQHFVLFEDQTTADPCPTCGSHRARSVLRHRMLVRGKRAAQESTWQVIKDEPRERLPWRIDEAEEEAREFATQ